jgi:2-hydroxy-6-oxonona-2,4-dienedioate hydrolase
MGAPSAMQLCRRHPDRCSALILLFPIAFAPHPGNEPPPRPSRFAQFLMDTTLNSDFAFWAASKLSCDTMMKTIAATPPEDFKNASPEEQARVLEVLRNIEPRGPKPDLAIETVWLCAASSAVMRFKSGRFVSACFSARPT